MKYILLLSGLCFNTFSFAAQNDTLGEYGSINNQELELISYEQDPSAEVVLLYEKGSVEFSSASKIIFRYYARYKIINPQTAYSVFAIPYSKGDGFIKEEIKELKGTAYNLQNGELIKTDLTKEFITDEQLSDNSYSKKVSVPALKKGTVFEYSYTKEIPFLLNHNPPVWYFQKSIPVQWSEFTIVIPKFLVYKNVHGGYLPYFIDSKEVASAKCFIGLDDQATKYRFVVKDAPAFQEMNFSSGGKNDLCSTSFYLSSIAFPHKPIKNYQGSWQKIVDDCLPSFENYFSQAAYLSLAANQIKRLPDSMQQIQAAFEYISKMITWNEETTSCLPVQNFQKVMLTKKAAAPEINLMLVSLLRRLGFEAYPVIISTRENGKLNDSIPLFQQFNYTIADVKWNGKNMLMDATAPLTKPGLLPERCLNEKGCLIKREGIDFISLSPTAKKADLKIMKAQLDIKTGVIKGNITVSADGYSALATRMLLKEQMEEVVVNKIKDEHPLYEYNNFEFENEEDLSQELKIYYDFKYKAEAASNTFQFSPLLSGKIEKNPFKETKRIYPVDLKVNSDHVVMSAIKIPKGYWITALPQSTNIELPDSLGKFTYLINVVDNVIHVSSRIMLNTPYFPPEKYWVLQNFYEMIIRKQSEQVVLQME